MSILVRFFSRLVSCPKKRTRIPRGSLVISNSFFVRNALNVSNHAPNWLCRHTKYSVYHAACVQSSWSAVNGVARVPGNSLPRLSTQKHSWGMVRSDLLFVWDFSSYFLNLRHWVRSEKITICLIMKKPGKSLLSSHTVLHCFASNPFSSGSHSGM